jgi:hypothetical protein
VSFDQTLCRNKASRLQFGSSAFQRFRIFLCMVLPARRTAARFCLISRQPCPEKLFPFVALVHTTPISGGVKILRRLA